ncbi:hypothetical protein NBRC116588_03330 [Pyruvatibacter sp. HU-CL02332]
MCIKPLVLFLPRFVVNASEMGSTLEQSVSRHILSGALPGSDNQFTQTAGAFEKTQGDVLK